MVDNLEKFANAVYNFALSAVILAAFTGILMHAIYAFGLRSTLQQTWVHQWLSRKVQLSKNEPLGSKKAYQKSSFLYKLTRIIKKILLGNFKHTYKDLKVKVKVEEIERDIVNLASAGDKRTLYSLSYSQLCGQISGAIRAELEYSSSESLIDVFAFMSPKEEREKIKNKLIPSDDASYNEIRERIVYHAERGVDELQVFLHRRWDKVNYFISTILAFILIVLLLLTSNRLQLSVQENLLYIVVGFAVGILAPVTQQFIETKLS